MEGKNKMVSIIVPVYNRAHLIVETLDSIVAQDYLEWECIIIDDDSTDDSFLVIEKYIGTDQRFLLKKRPATKPKGACSCRNYGFELCQGHYVQWFDSDDIMVSNHLSCLIQAIEENQIDFSVGDTQNFDKKGNTLGKPYEFDRENAIINARNFGKQAIGWITDDFLAKKEILENIRFNEEFRTDGDEYNFFTRLLHENNNGIFVNKILTNRRVHTETLSGNNEISQVEFYQKIARIKFITSRDIEKYGDEELVKWFLSGYIQYCFKIALEQKIPPFFPKSTVNVQRYFGFLKSFYFILAISSAHVGGKGYLFLKKAIRH